VLKGNVTACKPVSTGDYTLKLISQNYISEEWLKLLLFYTSHYSISL